MALHVSATTLQYLCPVKPFSTSYVMRYVKYYFHDSIPIIHVYFSRSYNIRKFILNSPLIYQFLYLIL
jgi:hypothetical protein